MSIVQKKVLKNWDKVFKGESSKMYPSLELVRLESMFFEKKRSGTILEYACGSGCNTEFLARYDYNLHIADTSNLALIKTKKRLKKYFPKKKIKSIHIKPQDKKLNIKDNSYDYIIAMSVLSLLGSKKNILKLLNEFKRVLKPNGKIIIDINDHNSEFSKGMKMISKNVFEVDQIGSNKFNAYCLKTKRDFEKLICDFFKIIDSGYSCHMIFKRRINEWIICGKNNK